MNPQTAPGLQPSAPPWETRAEELLEHLRTPGNELDTDALFALADLLPAEDLQPMETPWHRAAMNLLIGVLTYFWRHRNDFFVGGNMFVYYIEDDKRLPQSKGPDFFCVLGVNRHRPREKWVAFTEGKFPHVIIELLSPSTAELARTVKKDVYEQIFETDEYYLYDPASQRFEGWALNGRNQYETVATDERGWMWSKKLQLWLGTWRGEYLGLMTTWPRFYDANGQLVPQESEGEAARAEQEKQRAEQEKQRAEQEKQRADTAETELARLRALLAERERPNG